MARDFLEDSPTYTRKVSQKIRLRRSIVCKYLNKVYKLTRNSSKQIKSEIQQELASKNIEISEATISSDCQVYRSAFLFLSAPPDKKEGIVQSKKKSAPASCVGINCLIADGLYSFEEIEALTKQSNGAQDIPGEPVAEELTQIKESSQEGEDPFDIIACALTKIRAYFLSLDEKVSALESGIHSLVKEKEILENRIASMRHLLENKSPVQDTVFNKDIPEPTNHTSEKLESLRAELPKAFQWPHEQGTVIATKEFLTALMSFTREEQSRIIKQIKVLANEGRGYSSLQEKKIYGNKIKNTPVGSFAYRASDEIRFTCSKYPGVLKLLYVIRRGATGWSEA